MQRYWIRIALGALLVFGLGLAGLYGVRRGAAQVKGFLATAVSELPLRLGNLGFHLDGRRMGEVTALEIVRKSPDELGRLTGTVALTAPDAESMLRDCALTIRSLDRLERRTAFSCAQPSEVETGALVTLGEVKFEPAGFSRPLYVPQAAAAEWRHSGIRAIDARLVRDGHGGVLANGSFDVADHAEIKRGSFELRADSDGAVFSVRDAANRAVVDFQATKLGLKLDIRDRQGRRLLRLLADSLGAALQHGRP